MIGPFVFQSDAAGLQLIAARAPRDPMMRRLLRQVKAIGCCVIRNHQT